MTFVIGIEVRAKDNASGPLGKVAGSLGRMIEVAGGNLMADAIQGVGNAIADVGQQAFDAAGRFQVLEIGLETLISRQIVASGATDDYGAALIMAQQPAEDLLDWIKLIAVETPFTTESIADVARMGLAMKWSVPQVQDLAIAIGDFTAGMGLTDEHMQRIIYNFAQMVQQGKVTGTELRDLARGAFVPIEDVLIRMQENLGLTTMDFDKFRKAAAKGKYPIDEFIGAFMEISGEQFLGAMDRMALTWQTVTSNVQDFISAVLGAELLGPVVDKMSARVADSLQQLMTPEVRQSIQQIGQWIGVTFERIAKVLEETVLPAIGRFFSTLGVEAPTLEGIGDAIGIIAGKAETLGSAFADFLDVAGPWLVEHGDTIKEALLGIGVALLAFEAGSAAAGVFLVVAGAIAILMAGGLIATAGAIAIIAAAIPFLIAGIAVLVLAWHRNWGDIQGKVEEAVANIKQFFEDGIQGWKDAWENFKLIIVTIWDNIKMGIEERITALKETITGVFEGIRLAIETAMLFVWHSVLEPIILWFVGTFGPAFALGGALVSAVFDLIVAVVELFGATFTLVLTAIQGLWENVLLPTLEKGMMVFQAVAAVVGIVLKDAFDVVMGVVAVVVSFWKSALEPTFNKLGNTAKGVAATVRGVLVGAFTVLKAIFNAVWGVIKTGIAIIKGVFTRTLNKIRELISNKVNKTMDTWKARFDAIKGAIGAVIGIIRSLIRKIKEFTDKIKKVKLPSWLTPGSPTPFELGLRGIADAMGDVNRMVSPSVGLNALSAGGVSGGRAGGSAVNYVTINVSGVGDADAVARAIMHRLRLQGVKV